MNFTNEEFMLYLNKYRSFVDEISLKYNYTNNISHLLYVIVPAFVFKYGIREERYILDIFRNVPVIIRDRGDLVYQASFSRNLRTVNGEYVSDKCIYLYNYQDISLMQLLDNLVHEFNHAVNSIKNEVSFDDKHVYLRTGLTNILYDKNTLKSVNTKGNIILEEVINTRQTEMIIHLISEFSKYEIDDSEIENIIYSVKKWDTGLYKSKSYYLEATVCKKLLENRTFISTLENLRYQGEVLDLDGWFDNITGEVGSFKLLSELLNKTIKLEEELVNTKWFKKSKINKINSHIREVLDITDKFNNNCNYR